MLGRWTVPVVVVAVLGWSAAPAAAAFPQDGKRWRQLTDTVGVTWSQVAAVCPTDGASRCSGVAGGRDLTGWIWATDDQVVDLMGAYAPQLLTADPPSVSGPEYLFSAMTFLDDMKPTFFFSGYPTTSASASGWTASAVPGSAGGAGYTHPIFNGSFGVGSTAPPDEPSRFRGAWLWRPASDDLTPPVIRPVVSGTAGANGWYVSDVSVSWDVQDPESAATSACASTTVTADTAGTTLTCTATSGGGTATGTYVVRRDTTPPVVTCASPPQSFEIYQLGVFVTAAVTDLTSGPASPAVQGATSTQVAGTFTSVLTGADRAGNRRSATCTYRVVVPTCNGLTATIVGNGQNNTITGTNGPDVIVALAGADTINAGRGNDTICGGDGPDTIDAGDGNDWVDGGASPDDIRGGSGVDTCLSGDRRTSQCEV
jgi:hemolysin type calcium-binding protein